MVFDTDTFLILVVAAVTIDFVIRDDLQLAVTGPRNLDQRRLKGDSEEGEMWQ